MSIISGNIQSINAKFDEFSSFIDRVNTDNPISAILLQECWIDDSAIDSLALFNLKDLIVTINHDATGGEYYALKCFIAHHIPRNIYFVML